MRRAQWGGAKWHHWHYFRQALDPERDSARDLCWRTLLVTVGSRISLVRSLYREGRLDAGVQL